MSLIRGGEKGEFRKYPEVMMAVFADGFGCVVRTGEKACFDLNPN